MDPNDFCAAMEKRGFLQIVEDDPDGTAVIMWSKMCARPACPVGWQEHHQDRDMLYVPDALANWYAAVAQGDCNCLNN